MIKAWGSTKVVSRGVAHQADCLPGFIAEVNGQKVGLLTCHIQNRSLEIVTLNVLRPGKGIGRSLVERVRNVAVSENCTRIWVITTNDNKPAMLFYEAVGFKFVKIHRKAIEDS
ncbi:MAG: GNAT family N-acetyltransferase, partial [Candidatus Thorarchaeota archaeon]